MSLESTSLRSVVCALVLSALASGCALGFDSTVPEFGATSDTGAPGDEDVSGRQDTSGNDVDSPGDVADVDIRDTIDGDAEQDASDTSGEVDTTDPGDAGDVQDIEDPGEACERAACEDEGRVCVIVDDRAECGPCLSTGLDESGECPVRECVAARDCVSDLEAGDWSQCIGFANTCDDTGERVRERHLGECRDAACVWVRRAEREPCLGEPTDGDACATADGIGLCLDGRCAVGPDAPLGVVASDGTSPESVTVGWRAVDGAMGYRVFRDDVQIAEVTTLQWIDTTAGAGGVPEAPTNVVASTDRAFDIRVSWNESTLPPGASHSYTVRALNDDGISNASIANTGYRAPWPVLYYERKADDEDWGYVGTITYFSDPHGEAPTPLPGAAIASDGTFDDRVTLSLSGISHIPGASRSYVIRAVSEAGTGPESEDAQGRRAFSNAQLQWERSAGTTADNFSEIEFANRESETDMGAPADGSVRWYRCRITADALDPVWTTPDSGFRRP